MMEWITLKLAASQSGYSINALRNKIARGQLLEELHWRKAPDGRILIHVGHFNEWLKQ